MIHSSSHLGTEREIHLEKQVSLINVNFTYRRVTSPFSELLPVSAVSQNSLYAKEAYLVEYSRLLQLHL